MDPHFHIQTILSKKPLPIPEALALVQRLAPGALDLYAFHRLDVAAKRVRLTKQLQRLAHTAPSQMPVVQMAQSVLPKKQSIEQLLAAEFGRLEFVRLPDTLKLLVIRRYELKRQAVASHAQMCEATTDQDRLTAALATVEAMGENWDIWRELHHYHKTGAVLGRREEFKIQSFEDKANDIIRSRAPLEAATLLLGMQRTAANRIYKLRKDPAQADLCRKWIDRYNFLATKTHSAPWSDK